MFLGMETRKTVNNNNNKSNIETEVISNNEEPKVMCGKRKLDNSKERTRKFRKRHLI